MSIEVIIDQMNQLLESHRQLNVIAKNRTESLQNNDIDCLIDLNKQEADLLKKIRQIEKERLEAVGTMMNTFHKNKQGVSVLESLNSTIPEKRQKVLNSLKESLILEIEELKKQNDINQYLIKDSLRFVHYSLDILQPEPKEVNYQNPQNKSESYNSRHLFDSRM